MQYRKLGDSDLSVSEIALGSWLTYGGTVGAATGRACVAAAFDAGINFIDTANVYSGGEAEAFLGEVLKAYRRDDYVLATKLYFPMSPTDRGLSREQVHKQIDASLGRLRVDHVDLYQCHRYDEDTPLEETMEALTEVVRAGKARHIGFSEWSPAQIRDALALPDVEKFVSSQPQYSMLWRGIEDAVIPLCDKNGIGQIVWSPLAMGVLTGKYAAGAPPPAGSRGAHDQNAGFMERFMKPAVLDAVQRLGKIAQAAGLTLPHLALAWVLRQDNVASAIVGASRPEQVTENAAASGVRLSDDTLAEIDAVLADVSV